MSSVKHGKRYFKGMALEVATRNPERLYDFLLVFNEFDGIILDDKGIMDIYVALYKTGVVEDSNVNVSSLSDLEIAEYIKSNKSHNNEWGFPTGYQAAFCRYLKTLSEFGFIYSQYNEVFKISAIGKAVICDRITLSEAFSIQSMRFWRKSPYRRVLNDFNYFQFILNVLLKLSEKNKRLSIIQFYVSLFSTDGNVDEFLNIIEKNKFQSDDQAYEFVVDNYGEIKGEDFKNPAKKESCFRDYGNTVFRVLQLTGFITIENQGMMLIKFNKARIDLYNELLKYDFSLSEEEKESEHSYFLKLGVFEKSLYDLILKYREEENFSTSGYNAKIPSIVSSYNLTKEMVVDYLLDVSRGVKDKRCFWFVQAPVKFELLLTLLLYFCYGDKYSYKPNFKCDESGIPYSHAPGNLGDIEITANNFYWLVEATLIRNKTQQLNSETTNLMRHIDIEYKGDKYLSLVAPYLHPDTELIIKVAILTTMFANEKYDLFAMPQTTEDFVNSALKNESLNDIKKFSKGFVYKFREFINSDKVEFFLK